MVRSLILLRHGRTAYNASGRFQGQIDVPLDSLGLAQAKAAGAHLAQTQEITRIVSSDLTRARQTAEALGGATGLGVELDPQLREITVGEWEGLTREEVGRTWPTELQDWFDGVDMRPPGGESRIESAQRVHRAVERLVEETPEEATLALVAHGAVIRGATELLLGFDPRATGALGVLTNATYALLTPGRHGWVLRQWGGGTEAVAAAVPLEQESAPVA
ncbi:histidine phosphatase family protein [Brevibacterium album]|uniref:histidine phosphatase family protein n=1 Tax=Brevibacterium album TaxID=417948 RepID=UPI00041E618A|nr:histidine phosphatase family protein [Brevibacterium album]